MTLESGDRGQPTAPARPQQAERPSEPVPPVSRVRAGANFVFLVSGLAFLLGFLLTIALSGTLDESHMRLVTHGTAYAGFIAGVAFVTSFISILVENRTVPHIEEEEA